MLVIGTSVLIVLLLMPRTAETPGRVFGTLQSSPDRLVETTAAGVDLVTLSVFWSRFEPVEGRVDPAYVAEVREALEAYREAGVRVVLSTGVHHPPAWLLDRSHSRFVNQFGDVYASQESGKRVANMVFNGSLREQQQAYLGKLFEVFGTEFYGVRLGGGWFGELNYPEPGYNGRSNGYWGFDAIASGEVSGLPAGMTPNPVPGWVPGSASPNAEAARFAQWYLESLGHYHDWQIDTVREWYDGRLLMMYPSWGIRPGQLDAAVAGNLAGDTPAERNGEIQRGFDFARYIAGIDDPRVVVYTTWLNADATGDDRDDQRYWSPVKYLSHLATDRSQTLAVMGENTGRDSTQQMSLTFDQAREHDLIGIVWAFEPDLFGTPHATINDYANHITEDGAARG